MEKGTIFGIIFIIIMCTGLLLFGIGMTQVANNISETNHNVEISMDNNTRDAIMSLNETSKNIDNQDILRFNEDNCQYIMAKAEYWCLS